MRIPGTLFAIAALIVLVLGYAALFEVHQTNQAIVVRFGRPVAEIKEPGLHVKWPFTDSVILIDKRILDVENEPVEMVTKDNRLLVDAFARYRIVDPLKFYVTVGTVSNANSQLSAQLNTDLRDAVSVSNLSDVVRDKRADLMTSIRDRLGKKATSYGIEIVDVRIRRADLPAKASDAVYGRMQTSFQRDAEQLRAEGRQSAQEITAGADREYTVILANAASDGELVRGDGDAERNCIYAKAYNGDGDERDREFFAFYRSMQAYEASFPKDTRMLLTPDSDFFRYFGDPLGKSRPSAPAAAQGPAAAAPSAKRTAEALEASKRIAEAIEECKRVGIDRIGVRVQQVTSAIADSLGIKPPRGALVAGVEDKGAAKAAGLQAGDVIVKLEGREIKDSRDLPRVVADVTPGKDVEVVVLRKGKEESKTLKLSALAEAEKPPVASPQR